MSNKYTKFLMPLLVTVIMAVTGVSLAQAGKSKEKETKELQLFSQARISLSEAIKAAEQKTGGKTLEAELDDDSNTVQFEIEVVKDGKIHEVMIDGKTGDVVKVSLGDESDESSENEKE